MRTTLLIIAAVAAAALTAAAREPAPAAPAEPEAPAEPKAPAIEKIEGSRYRLGLIEFDRSDRSISFPAKVNMDAGIVEYAIVHESGKVHESLLSTTISPFDLNVVVLLLDYKPGTTFFERPSDDAAPLPAKNPKLESSSLVRFSITRETEPGSRETIPLESWLLHIEKEKPVSDGPFVYTGSLTVKSGFLAEGTGSILAVYSDIAALFNNPRENNDNDDIWAVRKGVVPARDTPVTVTIRPEPAAAAGPDGPKTE